jgi:hypothetical protein
MTVHLLPTSFEKKICVSSASSLAPKYISVKSGEKETAPSYLPLIETIPGAKTLGIKPGGFSPK